MWYGRVGGERERAAAVKFSANIVPFLLSRNGEEGVESILPIHFCCFYCFCKNVLSRSTTLSHSSFVPTVILTHALHPTSFPLNLTTTLSVSAR